MRRLALVVAALLLAACGGYDATTIPKPDTSPSAPPSSAPPAPTCEGVTRSFDPGGRSLDELRRSRTVEEIRARGRLIAGVSADTFKMASRDPLSGDLVGFDIDMVNAVARAIFPGKDLDDVITFRVITAADRIPVLKEDRVDVVVRNMTINCARWEEIAFSAVYYESGQKLLVRQDLADKQNPVDTVAELSGLRVCAPLGTTSLVNIEDLAPEDTEIVTAINHTQCLVKFQRGEADVITGDDTVLAGLAAQDPYAVVPPGQAKFTKEPYGIGVNLANEDLVRFINAVLERSRQDGSWQESYNTWLRPTLGEGGQPLPSYGR